MLHTRIAGIPCKVDVTHYLHQRPMGMRAASDVDCYGYTECEFTVCDLRGRPAAWLERKVTDADRERIAAEYAEAMTEDAL